MSFIVDAGAFDGMVKMLLEHGKKAENKAPEVLKAGAKVLIDAHKTELRSMAKTDRSTRTLANSIGMKKIRVTKTSVHTDVFPQGNQPHGHPRRYERGKISNSQVGFMLEHGYIKGRGTKRNHIPGRHWMAAANSKAAEAVHDAMGEAWEAVVNDG